MNHDLDIPGSGRPFGMAVVARPGQEHDMIQVMSAWDATIAQHKPPPQWVKMGNM